MPETESHAGARLGPTLTLETEAYGRSGDEEQCETDETTETTPPILN